MTRFFKCIEVVVLALLVLLLQSSVLAQTIEGPLAQANIHATHIASNFASASNSFGYYINPDTKRGYYSIDSTDQLPEKTASNVTTPIVNKTEIIHPMLNETTLTTISKNETNQPTANKTMPLVTTIYNHSYNTYYIYYTMPDNKTEINLPATSGATGKDRGSESIGHVWDNYNPSLDTSSDPGVTDTELGNALGQTSDSSDKLPG